MKNKIIFHGIFLLIGLLAYPITKLYFDNKYCQEDLSLYKQQIELDKKRHQERLDKLTTTLKKAKNVKKNDYNYTGNLNDDFLLKELK
jgi:hypothetical protein